MSFKIFTLQLTGKLKPVEKIEQQRKILLKNYQEFLSVEKSDELAEFLKLEEWIKSPDFKKQKSDIESLQFKGSIESKQLDEYNKLGKAKHLKKYFSVADSADLKRFEKLKESDKVKKYHELSAYINEGDFQKEKKEINALKFRGSVEENKIVQFKKLEKSAGIKAYNSLYQSKEIEKHDRFKESEKLKKYAELKESPGLDKEKKNEFKRLKSDPEIKSYIKLEKSKKYQLYVATLDSHNLKNYSELKEVVSVREFKEKVDYLKDKKKFEKSSAFKKYQEFKMLSSDPDVKFYLKFEKSSLYKNYLNVKDSVDLKRFFELKEITNSKEFLERKAYLEDKKKWEKSEAFAQQQKYLEMKKRPQLINYFKYKNSTDFDFFKEWDVAFEDDFSSPDLNQDNWSVCSYWADKMLGSNYSLAGDLQAYTEGANLQTGDKLSILVKKEKIKGKIWKLPGGFIPDEFEYSSGLVSTGKSFWQEDGIFEAKIKFDLIKQVVSSFYLLGDKNTPRVNLLEMGVKNRLGITDVKENGKVEWEGLDISNLKSGNYIFTIEKAGNTFTWKINEQEVLKMEKPQINMPLHLNASTLVVYDIPGIGVNSKFDIEWVKCYRKI